MTSDSEPTARREMAALLRKFARGGLTVEEFEREAEPLSERDSAASEAYLFAWYFYDDFKTGRLTGKWRLSPDGRRAWAKWVLFLMTSDEEYKGPSLSPSLAPLAYRVVYWLLCWSIYYRNPAIGAVAFLTMFLRIPDRIYQVVIDRIHDKRPPLPNYWPFASQEAFDRATRSAKPFALRDRFDPRPG